MLARLRASQSREDVVKFERELACEQLRPQVIRLKESLRRLKSWRLAVPRIARHRGSQALHLIPPYCGGLSPDDVRTDRFRIAYWAVTL